MALLLLGSIPDEKHLQFCDLDSTKNVVKLWTFLIWAANELENVRSW